MAVFNSRRSNCLACYDGNSKKYLDKLRVVSTYLFVNCCGFIRTGVVVAFWSRDVPVEAPDDSACRTVCLEIGRTSPQEGYSAYLLQTTNRLSRRWPV